MVDSGYEIMITQIASDGLKDWLGEVITKENFHLLKEDSEKFGFHFGFEGGYADTLILKCPLFKERLEVKHITKNFDSEYTGYVELELKKKNIAGMIS